MVPRPIFHVKQFTIKKSSLTVDVLIKKLNKTTFISLYSDIVYIKEYIHYTVFVVHINTLKTTVYFNLDFYHSYKQQMIHKKMETKRICQLTTSFCILSNCYMKKASQRPKLAGKSSSLYLCLRRQQRRLSFCNFE